MDDRIKPSKHFRDLLAWQSAYRLTIHVYALTKKFPSSEAYGLTSQLKRSIVSVTSNIAEGFGRRTVKEKDQFYATAHASLTEAENQLIIANGVEYITNSELERAMTFVNETHRLLYGLRKANKKKGEVGV